MKAYIATVTLAGLLLLGAMIAGIATQIAFGQQPSAGVASGSHSGAATRNGTVVVAPLLD